MIIETYLAATKPFATCWTFWTKKDMDPLHAFSDACREELQAVGERQPGAVPGAQRSLPEMSPNVPATKLVSTGPESPFPIPCQEDSGNRWVFKRRNLQESVDRNWSITMCRRRK